MQKHSTWLLLYCSTATRGQHGWCDIPQSIMVLHPSWSWSSTKQKLSCPHYFRLAQMACPSINYNLIDGMSFHQLQHVLPSIISGTSYSIFGYHQFNCSKWASWSWKKRAWCCGKGFCIIGILDSTTWNWCIGFGIYHETWLCSCNFPKTEGHCCHIWWTPTHISTILWIIGSIPVSALSLIIAQKSVLWLLQTVIWRPNWMLTRLENHRVVPSIRLRRKVQGAWEQWQWCCSGPSLFLHCSWLFWRHWLWACAIPMYFGF